MEYKIESNKPNKLRDTDYRRVVTREKGRWREDEEAKVGQIYGDDFGWRAHSATYRLCVIEMYT